MTIIYCFNTVEQRLSLWVALNTLGPSINLPWLVSGDFNVVLYSTDRVRGNSINASKIKYFEDCILNLGLNKLHWSGQYYTWSNKQYGHDRVCSRIDRTLGNGDWMLCWGHIKVDYDISFISDHYPMLLHLKSATKVL